MRHLYPLTQASQNRKALGPFGKLRWRSGIFDGPARVGAYDQTGWFKHAGARGTRQNGSPAGYLSTTDDRPGSAVCRGDVSKERTVSVDHRTSTIEPSG